MTKFELLQMIRDQTDDITMQMMICAEGYRFSKNELYAELLMDLMRENKGE